MKANPYIFREYDIRGIAEQDLTKEVVYHIARSYSTYVKRKGGKTLCIGSDVRLSSPRIKEDFIEGLIDTGFDVVDIGTVPTPVLYFSIFNLNADGGVQITASHNPMEFNGMKLLSGKDTLFGEEIQKIKETMESEDYETGKGKRREVKDMVDRYVEDITKRVKIEKEFKIAIDPGNGACGPVLEKLFKNFPITYKGVNMQPDGNFPAHLPDPTVEKYLKDLFYLMEKEKFDAGIGFDGDGDRIGLIDDKKRIVFGDKILAILSKKILKDYPNGKIIFDVKSSQGIVEYIENLNGVPIMWKTGHSLIKAKLKKEKAPLAGEMSGHIFFNDRFYGFDDAIYSSVRLLEVASEFNMKFSELHDEIPFYYSTPEIRVPCPDEKKFEVVEMVKDNFLKKFDVLAIDGARINFPNGFGLVRASNTQPMLVLRFEGKTREILEKIKGVLIEELQKYPEVDLEEID